MTQDKKYWNWKLIFILVGELGWVICFNLSSNKGHQISVLQMSYFIRHWKWCVTCLTWEKDTVSGWAQAPTSSRPSSAASERVQVSVGSPWGGWRVQTPVQSFQDCRVVMSPLQMGVPSKGGGRTACHEILSKCWTLKIKLKQERTDLKKHDK